MTTRRGTARLAKGALRALRLLAKPVRRSQGKAGTVVETYRGYGSRDEVFLIGRVFRQSQRAATEADEGWAAELRDIRRRITRRSVAGAVLTARFFGCTEEVVTDRDGYFRVHLHPRLPSPPEASWHTMELDLAGPEPVRAKGRVFIPSAQCRRVIISDIDDTIMHTGVANKLKMLWRLFVEDAENRVAFPGAAALYRALYAGPCGAEGNPMLYVSRAPWGLYDMLSEFFAMHRIPVGPVMFLREWGLSWTRPLPRRAEDHKRELIERMLTLYHDLPFHPHRRQRTARSRGLRPDRRRPSRPGRGGLHPQRLARGGSGPRDCAPGRSRGGRRQQLGPRRGQPRHGRARRRPRLHRTAPPWPRSPASGTRTARSARRGLAPTACRRRPCATSSAERGRRRRTVIVEPARPDPPA